MEENRKYLEHLVKHFRNQRIQKQLVVIHLVIHFLLFLYRFHQCDLLLLLLNDIDKAVYHMTKISNLLGSKEKVFDEYLLT
ncbi:MAG: hypothetical protein N3A61_10055, partial [Ignavibacteria bacterium]|nr:hypothetical protein [Ignavibacteria bacterium]